MFVKTLECSKCHAHYSHKEIHSVCTKCGSTLLVKYDLGTMKKTLKKGHISGREGTLWRYFEFLPVKHKKDIITLGEGFTPILRSKTYNNLWIKDESLNPTGTFKARGLAVAVSKAKEFGIKDIVMPSAGNAGAALSFYCARAGIKAHVYMPEDSPEVCKRECRAAGADIHFVKGTIKDAGARAKIESESNWFDMSTLKEPYRLEGKKAMGLEIAECFNWEPPDAVIYPTGGGTGLIGIWKAFQELEEMDWINKNPQMISVQASGCAPIVKAFEQNKNTADVWKNPHTIAAGLKVPHPFADTLILKTLRDSKGTAVTVTDEEIVKSIKDLAQYEGIYPCPEGAATYAAFKNLVSSGYLSKDERILLINTGSGLIYPF
ncbi:MAG: threonine synthase [Theionarchaea archaeon]|nr:threonine synthase [Theionarchaea archaeon]